MTAPSALDVHRQTLGSRRGKDALVWALSTFGSAVHVACSFGVEDVALLHLVAQAAAETKVMPHIFTLDTGRLPRETYDVFDSVKTKFNLPIHVYAPAQAAVEPLMAQQGPLGMRESLDARKACCGARKMAPLHRALDGAPLWVTGLRRGQGPTRSAIPVLERDGLAGPDGTRLKLNPLAAWTEQDVWTYTATYELPVHALHTVGYASIGCAPCTRAVPGWTAAAARAGDTADLDIRAGRWWWETADKKECGLHAAPDANPALSAPVTPPISAPVSALGLVTIGARRDT